MTGEQLANPGPRVVTVWSDIGCPWATLALATLSEAARTRDEEVLVDHRAFPLELFNRQPTPKHILDAEIVAIAARRPELGWRFWRRPEWQYPVTTLPSLEAVQAAKRPEVGGLPASRQLDTALRRAFYVDGRCISLHPVILDIAERCDLVDAIALAAALAAGHGRAQVYRDWEIARGSRVRGSPHVFTAAGYDRHNPGVTYHWTAPPGEGFPLLERYDTEWADALLTELAR